MISKDEQSFKTQSFYIGYPAKNKKKEENQGLRKNIGAKL